MLTDGKWKDVTARYASQWMTDTRKLRVDPEWWRETLEVFRCEGDSTEDEEIKGQLCPQVLWLVKWFIDWLITDQMNY